MTYFTEYIKSVISICFAVFLCDSICRGFSKSQVLNNGFRFLTNLCVFIVLILPLISVFSNFRIKTNENTVDECEKYEYETLETLTEKEIEKRLYDLIKAETGASLYNINVNIFYGEDEVKISSIKAYASSNKDREKAIQYITENIGNEITTEITVSQNENN